MSARVEIPDFCMAVVMGPTDAALPLMTRWFAEPEIVPDRDAAHDRLSMRAFAATHLPDDRRAARGAWVATARRLHAPPVALVVAPWAEGVPLRRLRHLRPQAERTLLRLPKEGFAAVHRIGPGTAIRRASLPCDRRGEAGPFDIVGDVHGHAVSLRNLLTELGYRVRDDGADPPPGRRAVFVGDLVDRGPASPDVMRLAMGMCRDGAALCVLGNHDRKLARSLAGRIEGDRRTMGQMGARDPAFRSETKDFIETRPDHLWLAGGDLVVVHAAIRPEMIGRSSKALTGFALHGPTTGRQDEWGHPIRLDWVADHPGRPTVVHGHVPVAAPAWRNGVLDIDTGCGMGGRLSALRWPEGEIVSVREA